ncbi:hypothetical protein V6Z11_1Z032500 [Gossypium hirsutum]
MAMCVEDRISSFPDPILYHILSFLPIKEAVRTSIISTKWRYLFASISTIKFDGYSMSDHGFDISGWICAALCRGVKEIDLQLSYLEDILPAVLFTCHSLVTLKLDATLHFRDSFFDLAFTECDFYNIRKINIQIPSFKRLILDFDLGESRDLNYVVVINAPNLVYFQYADLVAQGYTLSTMKSLEKAHITICGCDTIDS